MQQQTPLDELLARLREGMAQLVPERLDAGGAQETFERVEARLTPLVDAALAPFQILRREEFEGHLAALERLEAEVARLSERLAELEAQR